MSRKSTTSKPTELSVLHYHLLLESRTSLKIKLLPSRTLPQNTLVDGVDLMDNIKSNERGGGGGGLRYNKDDSIRIIAD